MKKVKVVCDCCNGEGIMEVERYPDALQIKIRCPSCQGLGYTVETLVKC